MTDLQLTSETERIWVPKSAKVGDHASSSIGDSLTSKKFRWTDKSCFPFNLDLFTDALTHTMENTADPGGVEYLPPQVS